MAAALARRQHLAPRSITLLHPLAGLHRQALQMPVVARRHPRQAVQVPVVARHHQLDTAHKK